MIIPHLSAADLSHFGNLQTSTARETINSIKSAHSTKRQEINLPKTHATKKGPLLLCVSQTNTQREASAAFDIEKKWLDNLSTTNLQASNILDNNANRQNMKESNLSIDCNFKLGKSPDYYIKNIKTISNKNSNKHASYKNYLPLDYNYKSELKNILNQIQSRSNSRLTSCTPISCYEGEGITSDDDDDDDDKDQHTPRRLSGRPILSAQNLIDKLHYVDKLKLSASSSNHLLIPNDNTITCSSIHYKQNFSLDDASCIQIKKETDHLIKWSNEISMINEVKILSSDKNYQLLSKRRAASSKSVKSVLSDSSTNGRLVKGRSLSASIKKNEENVRSGTPSLLVNNTNTPRKITFKKHLKKVPKDSTRQFKERDLKPLSVKIENKHGLDNSQPIPISFTQIRNEKSGENIKIYKFFDHQSLKIKSMSINQERVKSARSSTSAKQNGIIFTSPRSATETLKSDKKSILTIATEIVNEVPQAQQQNNTQTSKTIYLQPLLDLNQERVSSAPLIKEPYETRPRTPHIVPKLKRISSADRSTNKVPTENIVLVICDKECSKQVETLHIPFVRIEDLLNSNSPFNEIQALSLKNDFLLVTYSTFDCLNRVCEPNPLIKNKIVRLKSNDNIKQVYMKLKANVFLTTKNISLEAKKSSGRKNSEFTSKSCQNSLSSRGGTELYNSATEDPLQLPSHDDIQPPSSNLEILHENMNSSIVIEQAPDELERTELKQGTLLTNDLSIQSSNSLSDRPTPDLNDTPGFNHATVPTASTETLTEYVQIDIKNIIPDEDKLSDITEERAKAAQNSPDNSFREESSSYYNIDENFYNKTRIIIKLNEELLNLTSNLDQIPNENEVRNIEKEIAVKDINEHDGLTPFSGFLSPPKQGLYEQERAIKENQDEESQEDKTFREEISIKLEQELVTNNEFNEPNFIEPQINDSKLGFNVDPKLIQNSNEKGYKRFASKKISRQDSKSNKLSDKQVKLSNDKQQSIEITNKNPSTLTITTDTSRRSSILKQSKSADKYKNSVFDTLVSMKTDPTTPLDGHLTKDGDPIDVENKEKLAKLNKQRQENQGLRLPHMPFPYNSLEPVVDMDAYSQAFEIPPVLYPRIYKIDAEDTSLEELILERRILEEKIIEIKDKKVQKEKKKSIGSAKETLRKKLEEEMKEKTIVEERKRLSAQYAQRQHERTRLANMYSENIQAKAEEIQKLKMDLDEQSKNYENQIDELTQQLHEAISYEEYTRDALANARITMRHELERKYEKQRQELKIRQSERRDAKLFEYEVKKKEIKWVSQIYTDPVDLEKVFAQEREIEEEYDDWTENDILMCEREDREIDENEESEDIRLSTIEMEEEENALKPLQNQCDYLDEQKKIMEKEFDTFKQKLINRITSLQLDIEGLEKQKLELEHLKLKDIDEKKAALLELLEAEKKAKYQIQNELDTYRSSLMQRRDKNLKIKTQLSFMMHETALSEPCVFSYIAQIPCFNRKINGQEKKNFRNKNIKK